MQYSQIWKFKLKSCWKWNRFAKQNCDKNIFFTSRASNGWIQTIFLYNIGYIPVNGFNFFNQNMSQKPKNYGRDRRIFGKNDLTYDTKS